jgi:hypothetical protein
MVSVLLVLAVVLFLIFSLRGHLRHLLLAC